MQCNKFIVKHQQMYLDQTMGTIESAGQKKQLTKRVMDFSMA